MDQDGKPLKNARGSRDETTVPARPARLVAVTLWLVGSCLLILGAVLPYGTDCTGCRIIAPPQVRLFIWLPGASEVLVAAPVIIVVAFRILGKRGREYSVGILTGIGLIMAFAFVPYAYHPGFPGGGTFGIGGMVGIAGGLLVLVGGLLLSPAATAFSDEARRESGQKNP
jgi:hypothetical protein